MFSEALTTKIATLRHDLSVKDVIADNYARKFEADRLAKQQLQSMGYKIVRIRQEWIDYLVARVLGGMDTKEAFIDLARQYNVKEVNKLKSKKRKTGMLRALRKAEGRHPTVGAMRSAGYWTRSDINDIVQASLGAGLNRLERNMDRVAALLNLQQRADSHEQRITSLERETSRLKARVIELEGKSSPSKTRNDQVVNLRKEGYKIKDIAEAVGVSENSVKSTLKRARAKGVTFP